MIDINQHQLILLKCASFNSAKRIDQSVQFSVNLHTAVSNFLCIYLRKKFFSYEKFHLM
jgi:hypothetical protein